MCSNCMNNSGCGRSSDGDKCKNLGPFIAVDAACLQPEPPKQPAYGSLIPFSSGLTPATLVSLANGLIGTTTLVGLGSNVPGVTIAGNAITLPVIGNEALSVPRAGSINAISAAFRVTTAIALLPGTVTINAQIYKAPAGTTTFNATTASVDLTPIAGAIAVNTTVFGSENAFTPVSVAMGDRLLMVFSITVVGALGIDLITTVIGDASAGINIE